MEELTTLLKAKEDLKTKLRKGEMVICPCCTQVAKVYKRKISSSSAYALIILSKKKVKGEFHLERTLVELDLLKLVRSDFPKLRYWGLIGTIESKREDGSSRNGFYRITEAGRLFIENKITLPKYMHVYNNKAFKSSGERITILDCLGEKFNYNEIINL